MTNYADKISSGPCAGRLQDKVALVTGAGGGQGQVVSLLFAEAGATVCASDVNPATLEQTRALAEQRGLTIDIATVDASSPEQVNGWIDGVMQKHGRIDVLYNNGAGVHMAPFDQMTFEQWKETIRLELDVIYLPTKAVWPIMSKQKSGSIINIASCAGMLAAEGLGTTAHAAGKGGVIALTRQLSLEGAPYWIRVNCISPGPIMGPALQRPYDESPYFRKLFDSTPSLDRHGYPLDIAYAGLFLASDESTFITGVNLPIDGGATSKVGAMMARS
ncbi:SDR family NAD(P)-dependent oxidoreductase [Paraburkholderia sp. MM5384-R2]|uniref:SDR family NAD(P)-dependent oxidoreductase n=1 Tax=Paraburkholderia sp. MM5384-R2 TaxID=2723097 RepID=UPI001615D71F|nr:SDR family NAD(P)-dependent oxidoreductase [Paraburkholderia sp. MM5384-R2]MBB5497611.1 NAD(P)-dependent dehydrogenase (short-subunit alcohol dehydrogenase family) [Paraburkholderia sp. MM5384-R2]